MEERIKSIFKASIIGICVNIALGIFKAFVGLISHSIAITMDAINNFTDAGGSFITILGAYFAKKPANKKHPFGYGRTEYLGTLLIACIILYAGVTALVESIKSVFHPEKPEYSIASLIIIGVAVVVKIFLSLYVLRLGKKVDSDSLVASGKEALGDVAISIATLVAAIVFVVCGLAVEAYLGIIISIVIIKAGLETLMETVSKLLGTGAEVSLVRDIKKTVAEFDDVEGAFDLILHNYGPGRHLASIHIAVLDTVSVARIDELTREIQQEIDKKFDVHITAVGLYSVNTKDDEIIAIRKNVSSLVTKNPMVHSIHGFYIDPAKKIMRFDMVVSFDATDRKKLHDDAIAILKESYSEYDIGIGIDLDFNECE